MDGEDITPEEEARLKEVYTNDPDKIIPPKDYSAIKKELKSAYPDNFDIPNVDEFQSSLLDRIESEGGRKVIKPVVETPLSEDQSDEARKEIDNVATFPMDISPRKRKSNWFVTATAMAACFLIGLLINLNFLTKSNSNNPVAKDIDQQYLQPVFYSTNDDITAGYLSKSETNVIVIKGLEAIPDDVDLFSDNSTIAYPEKQPIKVYPNTTYPEYEN